MMNDDPDPVEEIRAIRAKIMKRFKTLKEYVEYLQTQPKTADEMLQRLREKNDKKSTTVRKTAASGKRKRKSKVHA